MLRARGIETGGDFPGERELLAAPSLETVLAAALACADEADLRRRLGNPLSGKVGFDRRTEP